MTRHIHTWGPLVDHERPSGKVKVRLCVDGWCPMAQTRTGVIFEARPERAGAEPIGKPKAIIKCRSPQERERILQIAVHMVAHDMAAGKVKPNDDAAFQRAVKLAVKDAAEAYRAAEEFMSG